MLSEHMALVGTPVTMVRKVGQIVGSSRSFCVGRQRPDALTSLARLTRPLQRAALSKIPTSAPLPLFLNVAFSLADTGRGGLE
jgi:hypothetical protein